MLIGKNWMKTATFAMVGDHWLTKVMAKVNPVASERP